MRFNHVAEEGAQGEKARAISLLLSDIDTSRDQREG